MVGGLHVVAELPKPRVGVVVLEGVHADRVPDAGEPVGDQHEGEHEEDEEGEAVFDVVVELAYNAAESQQAGHFERAENPAYFILHIKREISNVTPK